MVERDPISVSFSFLWTGSALSTPASGSGASVPMYHMELRASAPEMVANIDRLAKEGVRFTDAYAACAVCSTTRAAVLTGKYPARLLLTDWLPAGRWNPKAKLREGRFVRALPVEELTLAEALREGGYRTASIGKWHLGSEPFSLPEHHGFDGNIAGNDHGAPGSYFFPFAGDWKIPATGQHAKWNVLPDGKPGEYLTDRLTDEAVQFVRESKDKPFFLYFPHYGVHTPFSPQLPAPCHLSLMSYC